LQVSVDDYRGSAFVFAEFGEDLVGDGERDGELLQHCGDGFFVFWIRERKEQRDRDGIWLRGGDLFGEGVQFFRRESGKDFASAGGTFIHTEAESFRD